MTRPTTIAQNLPLWLPLQPLHPCVGSHTCSGTSNSTCSPDSHTLAVSPSGKLFLSSILLGKLLLTRLRRGSDGPASVQPALPGECATFFQGNWAHAYDRQAWARQGSLAVTCLAWLQDAHLGGVGVLVLYTYVPSVCTQHRTGSLETFVQETSNLLVYQKKSHLQTPCLTVCECEFPWWFLLHKSI